MPYCVRCGEIVDNTDDTTCKAILRFCMVYDISPRELIDIDTGRHAAIANAYTNLPDDAKDTIKDLAKKLKKGQSSTAAPKGTAKKPAAKAKSTKK